MDVKLFDKDIKDINNRLDSRSWAQGVFFIITFNNTIYIITDCIFLFCRDSISSAPFIDIL